MRLLSIRALTALLLVVAFAPTASAWELRLVRQLDPQFAEGGPADFMTWFGGNPGDLVTYDLYLDTEGESGLVLFSASIVFDPTSATFRHDLSSAQDYYPLYAPGVGKGPATWLVPVANEFAQTPHLWAGVLPPGLQQVNVDFVETNLRPSTATATNEYLATITFELAGGFGGSPIEFGFDYGGNIFNVNNVAIDDQVSTSIAWAPEPSTALLVGLGLAGLARTRRRDV